MFSCNFYEVFKNTFFTEVFEATASEFSSQAVYLDVIRKTSNDINCGNNFDYRKHQYVKPY